MTRCSRWLALLGAAFCANCAVAQSDFGISASMQQILVTPLRPQTVTLVVTNQGPGDLSSIAIESTDVDPTRVIVSVVQGASCIGAQVIATGGQQRLAWAIASLRSGASVACSVVFRAAAAAPTGNLLFVAFGAAAGNIDPNPFNNGDSVGVAYTALDAPVDVRIAARMDPGGLLRQGVPQRLRVTVTNVGTTVVPAVTVLSPGYSQAAGFIGFTGYDLFEITETAPCFMIVDAEPPFVFFVAFGFDDAPLPTGASRTCTVGIRALPGALGVGVAELPMDLFPRGPGVYDIAPQDNAAIVRIDYGTIPPRAVPLHPLVWLLVALAVGVMGAVSIGRRQGRTIHN